MRSRTRITLGLAAVGLIALSACSKGSSGAQPTGEQGVRTIRIDALDTLRFDPAQVTVEAGEKIRFVVTNTGSTAHEFILGDEEVQMSHEEEMGPGGSMEHGGMKMPALELSPGQTMETVVTFDEVGTILYGCHEPGHYKGGMVGTITVR